MVVEVQQVKNREKVFFGVVPCFTKTLAYGLYSSKKGSPTFLWGSKGHELSLLFVGAVIRTTLRRQRN